MGPDRALEQRRVFLNRMGEGTLVALTISAGVGLAFQIADQESYFQVLRTHVEVPQTAMALCLVAGLANALRAIHTNRLPRG